MLPVGIDVRNQPPVPFGQPWVVLGKSGQESRESPQHQWTHRLVSVASAQQRDAAAATPEAKRANRAALAGIANYVPRIPGNRSRRENAPLPSSSIAS